jgi:hypothetical protein
MELKNKVNQLKAMQLKSKFESDMSIPYPGLQNNLLKVKANELINRSIDDFILLISDDSTTTNDFQKGIAKGLDYFTSLECALDTIDKERICLYFEEIMDIIGLTSSDGILNKWMYGFDVQ